MKKLDIKGASNFVNRMFEACGKFQWAREFLKNALEAGATQVEFGIEWQAVKHLGVYRRTVTDNGAGMTPDQLLRFFSTLGEGGKKIGGVHDNFGVGAKIASLPWNPDGLVVVSYREGKGSMIWIYLDEDSGEYGLTEFETAEGKTCVIDPNKIQDEDGIQWGAIGPNWAKDHGTVIILLGSEAASDTILGNPNAGENDLKGLSTYLNTRFWDLSNVEITVVELRSDKKNQWPQAVNDKDDVRRPNNRTIKGARYYLTEVKAQKGKLAHTDVLLLADDRITLEWYLWEGERPDVHTYAKRNGYIAIRYGDELFHVTSGKVEFRSFGIIDSAVQSNLTLILEPQHYQAAGLMWGVHPDQSRNHLHFSGNGEKGGTIPLFDWGTEFAEQMPKPIMDAIRKAREGATGSIDDDDYRKRLQERFGQRWTMKMLVAAQSPHGRAAVPANEQVNAYEGGDSNSTSEDTATKPKKRRKVIATTDGAARSVEKEVPVDVPRYAFGKAEDFEQPWHMALWAPNNPEGPTVLINLDSPILLESIEHHLKQYPDVFAEEVMDTVRRVFGELAVAKVAHAQMLKKHINEQELDDNYRNERSLTVALMGLLAEESVISKRLSRLGQKKHEPQGIKGPVISTILDEE